MDDHTDLTSEDDPKPRVHIVKWARNRFFTGVIIALPIVATILAVSWIVQSVDDNVLKFVPELLNPKTYLGFQIPGLGLIISIVLLFLLGILASNFLGKIVIGWGERALARVPVVSPLYNAVKQIVQTVAAQKDRAFRDVCLIEYPRKGVWALGFVTADLAGAPRQEMGRDMLCVFVPTTPNPTSGFLLFVDKEDIRILDMSPEEGAKMIISGGMVSSNPQAVLDTGKPPKVPKPPKSPKPVKPPKR